VASWVDGVRSGAAAQAAPPTPAQAAQAAPPAAAGKASAIPAASAPVDTPAASPDKPDQFDLIEALRGTGPAYSSQQVAQRAKETAPSVAKAEAAAQRAEAAAASANVTLYPRLELEARYTRLSDFTFPDSVKALQMAAMPGGQPLLQKQLDTGLFQARLSWPVSTLFFATIPRHKAALETAEAQKFQRTVELYTVSLRTREAYYNYARTRAARSVAVAALAQAEAHRRDTDALVNAGSIARVELVRADAQVASAKVSLARAEFSVQNARSALATLVHAQKDVEDITVSENLETDIPGPVEDEKGLYAKALERRSELKALTMLMQAQEHTVSAYKGVQLPAVVIGGTAEEANPNQRIFGSYNEWKGTWAAQVALIWSPNDTFTNGDNVDVARADLAQTVADLDSLRDALRIEISQAFNGWAAAFASLEAARAGITSAEESYRVRREQFRAGAAIAVDVIDAETQLRSARLDLVNSLIDTRIAKARIDRAVEADGY
jgi:outer membrane protein TolC